MPEEIVFETIIDFLEKSALLKTAQILRKELSIVKNIVLDKDKERKVLSNFSGLNFRNHTKPSF